ncbi:uncharacterized protein J8A68_000183 [[Candida] subhashii]|uniref:PX domain-containing protein n=1 Tax=[Candida] subhashii TaxID=561895 RepID=A0A8J5USC4_9ASCO|nr:uncharacterized protein J8A68_000183 [[Candida] subhashii]KAG7666271.1 hypothetical protein J8A68_000183 [[Candida] subhashii]
MTQEDHISKDGSSEDASFLNQLTPTQEHFLKKYLLENRLVEELHTFSDPLACQLLGKPFKTNLPKNGLSELPLLSFFFQNFLVSFPFITNNSEKNQEKFWQGTLQPFIESLNSKPLSNSEERQENITKRRQINKKFLSLLLLFYNSTLITKQELTYLNESHYKPSDTGKLDKFQNRLQDCSWRYGLEDYNSMKFLNDISINIIAVRTIKDKLPTEAPSQSWTRYLFSSEDAPPRHHYEFVIQIVTREKEDASYSYESSFISRHYKEFKGLDAALKKAFPGIMSGEVSNLPRKEKNDLGYNVTSRSGSIDSTFEVEDEDEDESNGSLAREKLRVALRGYLRSVTKIPALAHSIIVQDFLLNKEHSFSKLTTEDLKDYNLRMDHEETMLKTRYEFQQQTTKVMAQFAKDFEDFTQNLIMNPKTISELFEDLGKTSDINKLSPLFRTFNEWCKLEIAATLYETFLSQDNSNEWFNKCKKFHRLFPYSIVYGILRFTNPVNIVSKVIDLLLINIPRFSWPSWGGKPEEEKQNGTKKPGARNLLSLIFIMLLGEDLSTYEKELKNLRQEKLGPGYSLFLKRLENYTNLTYVEINLIKDEAMEKSQDLLLTILSTDLLEPKVTEREDRFILKEAFRSHDKYVKIVEDKDLDSAELYLNLKQYWQILVRKKDKDVMKQLWEEPELTNLIKDVLSIFYQPLMKLFAKSDVHIVFRAFQKFADDLVATLTKINNEEIYYLNSMEIYTKLKQLLDNHEKIIWEFIHNIYIKDDQKLFLKLINWIEKFLAMLRLKFADEELVKMQLSTNGLVIDEELALRQLDARVALVVQRRRLFKEYLSAKSSNIQTAEDMLVKEWDNINEQALGNASSGDFGLHSEDLEEFNNLNCEGELETNTKQSDLEKLLSTKLRELELVSKTVGTSELDKLDPFVKAELTRVLGGIHIE